MKPTSKLTKKQQKNVEKAISLARKQGGCTYIDARGPCCIIGQLAALEGVSNAQLKVWNEFRPAGQIQKCDMIFYVMKYNVEGADKLKTYPPRVLDSLQIVWDHISGLRPNNRDGRARLNAVLKDWKGS